MSCNDTTSTSKKQKHSTILPMLTIRAEIKANICSIALELKYNNQVLLHCLKVSTLSTNFLIITRFFIVFFLSKKAKNHSVFMLEENLRDRSKHFGCSPLSRFYYNFDNFRGLVVCPSFASFSSHTGTNLSYAIVLQLYLNFFFSLTSLSKFLLFCLSTVGYYITLPYLTFFSIKVMY